MNLMSKYFHFCNLIYLNIAHLRGGNEFYQPTYGLDKLSIYNRRGSKRSSDDRLTLIIENLPHSANSYLDIGSQHGYFVLTLAERLGLCVGIEGDRNSYFYSKSLCEAHGINNAVFVNLMIDSKTSAALPSFDVISFLSVFHHIVHFQGRENAMNILENVSSKCNVLFFETGEPQEIGQYWTNSMQLFSGDFIDGMRNTLLNFGFSSVEVIGCHETHLTGHKRSLFKCTKSTSIKV
jgi:hypothetical protein